MENKKEKTTPDVSVGADTEQPISKKTTSSISENSGNIKSFEESQREMQLRSDPSYLQTISMNELFDTQYRSKQPLIDGLMNTHFSQPSCPVYQNVNAQPVSDPEVIKKNLIAQLTASVRWTQTVQNMLADGASSFLEIGPGNVLQGLIKKVSTEVETAGMQ